jgi:pilus assembly protein CpaE
MRLSRNNPPSKTHVVVLTADSGFAEQARLTFGASPQIALTLVQGSIDEAEETLDLAEATVAVIDLDASRPNEMEGLERLMARTGAWPPVIVVTQTFDESVARAMMQMRVADFMVKPVAPVELVRTCARVAKGTGHGRNERGGNLHLPARRRRRGCDDARGPDRDDAA